MNYLKIYCNLIRKAENRTPPEGYTEKHHTFPVSIYGKNNRVVILSGREHYIAHALLEKICIKRYGLRHWKTKKMNNAHILMKSSGYFNSYLYESAKIRRSENMKGNINMLGKKHSKKTKEKIGKSNLGKKRTEQQKLEMSINSPWKGKKHNEKTKEKIGKTNKGRKKPPFTQEHIEKLRIARTGRILSEKSRQKIRESNLGKKRSAETIQKMKENHSDVSGSKNPNSKTWEIISNTGEKMIIDCLFEWAKTNGYNPHRLYDISSKKQKTHKDIISVQLLTN